jgi:hypothetical protein
VHYSMAWKTLATFCTLPDLYSAQKKITHSNMETCLCASCITIPVYYFLARSQYFRCLNKEYNKRACHAAQSLRLTLCWQIVL